MGTEEKMGDPADPTKEPPKKIGIGLRGKKWEEEKAKREGPTTIMMERFEDILAKNEETCVKRSDIKETCKADRSSILMAMTEKTLNFKKKKVGLEEKKVEFATSSEETNVLTLKMKDLDDDTRMIVQALLLLC
ncbi:hypothetical protein D1007_07312 [Hordeum vulgare]|nr:hypothetical protein D1007_07312 [Hordeum vulgare]